MAKEVVSNKRKKEDRRPKRIEEVPFRRQDQRTLNAKKRRDMDNGQENNSIHSLLWFVL